MNDELTPFQQQLEGEDMGRFHRKDAFMCLVTERARAFLELKPTNSVRLLWTLHLEEPLAQKVPLGSPAIVRMRVSRIAGTIPRVECRFATASSEHTATSWSMEQVDSPFAGNPNGGSLLGFLGLQFGKGTGRFRWHYPHVSRVDARIMFREPLGVLAMYEGSSDRVVWHGSRGVIEHLDSLSRIYDHPALSEL
jgi:hypothetical protein